METPIYLKESEEMEWPNDKMFYLLTADGMMLCRNSNFFSSCVKAPNGVAELEDQDEFITLKYPKIPKAMLEQIAGFFSAVDDLYDSEAIVLLCWNTNTKSYEIVCPPQEISVQKSSSGAVWGSMDVQYTTPTLPPHLMLLGDIHSHVNMSAFSSMTDTHDEISRPGIHAVIGKIRSEPPEFHIEVVVDDCRFKVKFDSIFEGYAKRSDFPREWLNTIHVKEKSYTRYVYDGPGSSHHDFGQGRKKKRKNQQQEFYGDGESWGNGDWEGLDVQHSGRADEENMEIKVISVLVRACVKPEDRQELADEIYCWSNVHKVSQTSDADDDSEQSRTFHVYLTGNTQANIERLELIANIESAKLSRDHTPEAREEKRIIVKVMFGLNAYKSEQDWKRSVESLEKVGLNVLNANREIGMVKGAVARSKVDDLFKLPLVLTVKDELGKVV